MEGLGVDVQHVGPRDSHHGQLVLLAVPQDTRSLVTHLHKVRIGVQDLPESIITEIVILLLKAEIITLYVAFLVKLLQAPGSELLLIGRGKEPKWYLEAEKDCQRPAERDKM